MNSMADADSLHETNSDLDQDLSAIDADDENPEQRWEESIQSTINICNGIQI